MSAMESLSVAPRLSPAQRAIALLMREEPLAEAEYTPDGTITLLDHDCQVVQRWTSDQLRSIVQGHGAILDESEAPPVGCRCIHLVRRW